MNWKGKSADPQIGRIDFAKLEADIKREETPRVSEYAPRLRDRMEAATSLTKQERDKATQAMIHEATVGIEQVRELAAQSEEKYERLINAIQEVTKRANEEQQQTLDRILGFCDLLDQVKEPPPRNHKAKSKPLYEKPTVTETDPKDAA